MAEPAKGFVMMPFRNDPNTIEFWNALQHAAHEYEYLTIHRFGSESLTGGNDLFDAIREDILRADFCLEDFTPESAGHPNLNVLTEAGISLGAKKSLYLMARTEGYAKLNAGLPSDWKGQYVETFPVRNGGQWAGLFRDYFEKILADVGRPTTPAKEKPRENDGEQMRWILALVQRLRDEVRDLYDGAQNGVVWTAKGKQIGGLPSKYSFTLTSPQAPKGVRVNVGAFFDQWNRGGTPLHVGIQKPDDSVEYVPVMVDKPLTEATTKEVVAAFIAILDQRLIEYTPGLSRPTLLGRAVMAWESTSETIRKVVERIPDLVGEKTARWNDAGFLITLHVSESRFAVRVGIDLERWAERDRSPVWIAIEPQQGETPELLGRVKLPGVRALRESGSILLPIPMDDEFEDTLDQRMRTVIRVCKKAAPVTIAINADGEHEAVDYADAGDSHRLPAATKPPGE